MNQLASNIVEFTVSELSFALRRTVEGQFEHVRVRGEVSGFKGAAGSGHCYFRLKDDQACLDAVVWKTTLQRLRFKPAEGLEMVATGKLTTYPGRSSYQIIVEHLEPAGAGALMALLEERRKKLQAEGLFDPARKRPIPYLPRVIGVVTSPTGAVIRDILHRLRDRFPSRVIVWPVRVQGEGAAGEVAAAIRGFNAIEPGGRVPRPDVLIIARGGGSVEDLWAFNEEVAVRAVAAGRIPTIAAIGHETDTTLIDHAADRRAPTPTGAAEMAVPVRAELLAAIRELASRHELSLHRSFEARRHNYLALCRALPSLGDILALPRQKLDDTGARLGRGLLANVGTPRVRLEEVRGRLGRSLHAEITKKRRDYAHAGLRLTAKLLDRAQTRRRESLGGALRRLSVAQSAGLRQQGRDVARTGARLDVVLLARTVERHRTRYGQVCRLLKNLQDTVSHHAVLARGYAIVTDASGRTVRSPETVAPGAALHITVAEGEIAATVGAVPPPPRIRRAPRPPRQAATTNQGRLF